MKEKIFLGRNSKEQKQAILYAKQGDQEALNALLEANENLIISRLEHFGITYDNSNYEDYIVVGKIALIKAIESFDFSRGTAFSTYAVPKIDQKIRTCPIDRTTLNMPHAKHQELLKFKKTKQDLLTKLGRTPTLEELSRELNFGAIKTSRLEVLSSSETVSLDENNSKIDRENSSLHAVIGDPRNNPFEIIYGKKNLNQELLNTLLGSNLTDDEIITLLLRFGIETPGNQDYTLDEISILLGVTRESVRQRANNAIDKLRNSTALFTLIEYSQNPSLLLKKIKIKRAIREQPFSKEYPDIYSYFQEYTKIEIDEILNNLTDKNKKFLKNIREKSQYTYQDSLRLFEIISKVYNELVSIYGRRPLISYEINTEINYQSNSKENIKRLNKIYKIMDIIFNVDYYKKSNFWEFLKERDIDLVKRSLMYITNNEYNLLTNRYGTNLDEVFIEYEDKSNDIKDLLEIREIADKIKAYSLELQNENNLVSNLFTYFKMYPKDLVLKEIDKLSDTDKNLLYKRFGTNFENSELELIRLSEKEYTRLSKIIKILDKNLYNEYNLIKAENSIDIPKTIYSIYNHYDKNLITYTISKLSSNSREALFRIFGTKLFIKYEDLKKRKINKNDLKIYNYNIINFIRDTFKKNNIETMLDIEKQNFKKNIANISINEVIESSSYIFEEEKEILDKAISIGIDNISTLPINFQLAFYGVFNRIVKEKKEKIKYHNTLKSILDDYKPNQGTIENSMILFLYLGVGENESVPINIISKTFDIEESQIKKIILLELTTLKEKLLLKPAYYNTLVKRLKNK